ncbi:hypothetical protein ACQEXA_37120 [Streptomyces sp. CA-106110]
MGGFPLNYLLEAFGNPYGHPAPGTVAALREEGAMVLRTDEDGAIAVVGAGAGLRVARD